MIFVWILFSLFIVIPFLVLIWIGIIYFKNIFFQNIPLLDLAQISSAYGLQIELQQKKPQYYETELVYVTSDEFKSSFYEFVSLETTFLASGLISGKPIQIACFKLTKRALLRSPGRFIFSFTTRIAIDGVPAYSNVSYDNNPLRYGDKSYAPSEFVAKVLSDIKTKGGTDLLKKTQSLPLNRALFVVFDYICIYA